MSIENKNKQLSGSRRQMRRGGLFTNRNKRVASGVHKAKAFDTEELNFVIPGGELGLLGQIYAGPLVNGAGEFQAPYMYFETLGGIGFFSGIFCPAIDNFYPLGSSSYRWTTIYLVSAPVVSSDIRFKREILPINSALDIIEQMTPIEYIRDEKKHYGFSAQELQKILPEIVEEAEDGELMIRPDEIVPFLVKAVQELSYEVDILSKKIENLKEDNV